MAKIPSTIVLLSTMLMGIGIAASGAYITSMSTQSAKPTQTHAANGKKIFIKRCSGCHTTDGNEVSGMGPNLADIGQRSTERVDGLNRIEYIVQSIVDPDAFRAVDAMGHMPRGTLSGASLEQARDLIAYVGGLGAGEVTELEFEGLSTSKSMFELEERKEVDLTTLQLGQALFFEKYKCDSCHSIYNNPGESFFAPSLGHASNLSPNYIRNSLRQPSNVIASGYEQITVTIENGDRLTGRLLNENSASVVFLTHSEKGAPVRQVVLRENIKSILHETKSSMPAFELSETEELALIEFLGVLEAEIPEP